MAPKEEPRLIAVTVDHGLRPEAKREALAVKKLARSLRIERETLRWTGCEAEDGNSGGRACRAAIRLLGQVAQKAGGAPVLTARTQDDQAETVLFRMMRGSERRRALPGMRVPADLLRRASKAPKARAVPAAARGSQIAADRATLKVEKIPYAEDPLQPRSALCESRGSAS